MTEFLSLAFPLFIVVAIIIAAYYATKWIAEKQKVIMSGKIIRVIERVPLTKDTYLLVIVVDGKPYLASASGSGVQLLMQLSDELLENHEAASGGATSQFAALFGEMLKIKKDKDDPSK